MLLETNKFEFGEFYLNAEEKVLLRCEQPVSITPKALQLLLVLVKNKNRPIKKSELMREVWADSFVEEGNLTFTINLLRKALGDDRNNPRFIETIPKYGYRFIAEVKTAVKDAPFADSSLTKSDSSRSGYLLAVSALIILFAAVTGLWFYLSNPPKTTNNGSKSILVLPLKPIDQNARDGLYEFGIADSVIQRLGTIKGLAVRPLSAGRRYAETEEDPVAIGREQRVEYVLASNYQIAGGKIRVTAQLLNVESGQIEETRKTEKDLGDVFAVQDAVSEDVSKLFQTRFGAPANSPTIERGTENEEAHRLYYQAMYLLDKETLADQKRAMELFEQALKLDPNYAKAWAGSAQAYCAFAHYGGDSPEKQFESAKPALDRALAINPDLPEAHAVLGIIRTDYDWDFPDGEKSMQRAIELAPKADIFYRSYAYLLSKNGRHEEAIANVKTAIDINPSSIFHQIAYGRILYFAHRYDDAIKQLERVSEMDSTQPWLYANLWRCFHQKGDYPRAYEAFMKSLRLQGTKDEVIKNFEKLYAEKGWESVLRKMLEIIKSSDVNGSEAYTIAELSTLIGEREQAFQYLNEAVKFRSLEVSNIKGDPGMDPLRDDARFNELIRQIEQRNKK